MTTPVTAQALLESVHRARRDDDARRVYADCLVERGDPRGEFIHLQLDRSLGQSNLDMYARELALLAEHGEAWTSPLGEVASRVEFERGFPAQLELDGRAAGANLPALVEHPSWATIDELSVMQGRGDVSLEQLRMLVDQPCMAGLERITAAPERLLALAASKLRRWQRVTMLDVGTASAAAAHELVERLPALVELGGHASYAGQIAPLCELSHAKAGLRALTVMWWDNGHAPERLPRFMGLIEASAFEFLRWVDTSMSVELHLRRDASGRWHELEGDLCAIDEDVDEAMLAGLERAQLYWDPEEEAEDYARVRARLEAAGVEVRVQAPVHRRALLPR